MLLEELAEATLDGTRKDYIAELATVPLLIIDDLGMRKLPTTAAEDLLELIMRRYERGEHAAHLEPARRRLGQAARRHRRRHRDARPPPPPRPRPQVRTAELAHEDDTDLQGGGRDAVERLRLRAAAIGRF